MSRLPSLSEFGADNLEVYRRYLEVNSEVARAYVGSTGVDRWSGVSFAAGGDSGADVGRARGWDQRLLGRACGEWDRGMGVGERCGIGGCASGRGRWVWIRDGCDAPGDSGQVSKTAPAYSAVLGGVAGPVSSVVDVGTDRADSGGAAGVGDAADGGGVGVVSGIDAGPDAAVGTGASSSRTVSAVRGPNWDRNRKSRERRKAKARASRVGAESCQVRGLESVRDNRGDRGVSVHCASSALGAGQNSPSLSSDLVRDNQEGFWNSCSADVRQELIDSKARMHIAENERRTRKAREEVAYLDSPEAMLRKAMSMVNMAESCAKKKNDHKVAGWAETVATSYAESIAKSVPSSVPSYASVVSGSSATSVSVDGTKREKPQKREYTVLEHRKRINGAGSPAQMEAACDVLSAATNLPTADKARLMNFAAYRRQAICGPQVFA